MPYCVKLKLSLVPSAHGEIELRKRVKIGTKITEKIALSAVVAMPSVQTTEESCSTENETRALN